jgi:hypothetical protein
VFDVAHELKQKLNYERRQARLASIEQDFAHEIVLVDPARSFVREGQLLKFANSSAAKKVTLYTFMLFNDLILYASEGINSKWKCHRVIHLSLCRIEDLRGLAYENMHAFRIVSPQKSITVSAPTKEKKQAWLQAIVHHLELVMVRLDCFCVWAFATLESRCGAGSVCSRCVAVCSFFCYLFLLCQAKRRKYIEEARAQAAGGVIASPLSPSDGGASDGELVSRGMSNFIGISSSGARQSDNDLMRFTRQESANGGAAGGVGMDTPNSQNSSSLGSSSSLTKPAANHCKLCIRPWAMFRRKQKCRWCTDLVCSDCCEQKCIVPGGAKRLVNVCDACFGIIKGMVGDNVKLLTVCDT